MGSVAVSAALFFLFVGHAIGYMAVRRLADITEHHNACVDKNTSYLVSEIFVSVFELVSRIALFALFCLWMAVLVALAQPAGDRIGTAVISTLAAYIVAYISWWALLM